MCVHAKLVVPPTHDNTVCCVGEGAEQLAGWVEDMVCPSLLPSLLPALSQAGWHTSHHLLAAREWRYSWKN